MAKDGDAKIIRLVPKCCSLETAAAFEAYARQAKDGAVLGAALIIIKPWGDYEVDILGEARDQPEFVRGINMVLDDQLAKLIGSR